MEKDNKAVSLNFLVCCYFGQSKDLIKDAIDRAYVCRWLGVMQSTTMIILKYEEIMILL